MNAWKQAHRLCVAALLSLATAGCLPVNNAPGFVSPLMRPVRPLPQGADAMSTPANQTDDGNSGHGASGGVPGELLNAILADAGRRLGVDAESLTVTRADAVTWPNSALGCPEPGMYYMQVLVNGYWIIVETDTQRLDYRAQADGYFRLCERPGAGRRPLPFDPTK